MGNSIVNHRRSLSLPLWQAIFSGLTALLSMGCGSSFTPAVPVSNSAPPSQPAASNLLPFQVLKQDVLIAADLWDTRPRILAAGLGFTDIIGVPGLNPNDPSTGEIPVRAVGGTWNEVVSLSGAVPTLGAFTSAVSPAQVAATFGKPVVQADAMPIEFSYPILPSSLDPGDLAIHLNDGSVVTPQAAALNPNFDFNERAVVVVFGEFANRLDPSEPGARYPVLVEVVGDLQLVGPGGGIVSATGLSSPSGTPYGTGPGPRLVAAKLTRMSAEGDGAPAPLDFATPNDGIALYGARAQYRIRVFTSGGFSPDGVRGMFPTEFARYFRLRAGNLLLTETDVAYKVNGGSLKIVGLAELGRLAPVYDDTYQEDQDNQIDIVLEGDEVAMRGITEVEVPSAPPYSPLYNPGGPGNRPSPGVRYSNPSPPHSIKVLQALDIPLQVTLIRP